MKSNQQDLFSNKNLPINQNFIQDYEKSTSTKTFKQLQSNVIKSPPSSPKPISPLTQMMEIKNIKNEEFLFRMKLKFIACMQQLEVSKEEIQFLRKQENDSEIISSFINPIKKEFAVLKKVKQEYLLKQGRGQSSRIGSKNLQSLQIISLQSHIQQISDSQKKIKHRCQKLFTQNAQLMQKLKKKQNEFEQVENNLYQTKLLLKEYESVIQNLKSSSKKVEKNFLDQRERLKEDVNAFRELMMRQKQAKQIYLSKLQTLQATVMQNQGLIKSQTDEISSLKKQCMKWKNRSEWSQNQTSHQTRMSDKKIKCLQEQIQKLLHQLKKKDCQIQLAKRQASNSTEVFNKKLQKIVEEWKTKLIHMIQEYQTTIENQTAQINQLQEQNHRLNNQVKDAEHLLIQNQQISLNLSTRTAESQSAKQKAQSLQAQLKQNSNFYTQKINQLESIIFQLKSENLSKSMSIDQSKGSHSQLEEIIRDKTLQIQNLEQKLLSKQTELIQISQSKKATENQLLKKISTSENNRIIQVSKLKVQNQQQLNQLQSEIHNLKSLLEKQQIQNKNPTKTLEFNSNLKEENQTPNFSINDSSIKSSEPSVNNSINMKLSNERSNDRTNRLVTQTYVEPARKSSIRRVFVRSNSINEYLKQSAANKLQNQAPTYENESNMIIVKKAPNETKPEAQIRQG